MGVATEFDPGLHKIREANFSQKCEPIGLGGGSATLVITPLLLSGGK